MTLRGCERVAVVVLLCGGCVYRPTVRTEATRTPTSSEVRLRTDGLPGKAELVADGRLRFTVDVDRLCQRFVEAEEVTITHHGAALSGWFWGYLGGMAATGGAGLAHASLSDDPLPGGLVVALLSGVSIFFYGATTLGLQPFQRRTETSDPRAVTEPALDARCEDGLASLESLMLSTPWGAEVVGAPSPDGVIHFEIDWSDEQIAADPEVQLATPWRLASAAPGPSARWSPSEPDRRIALGLIAALRDRVITGSTPARLAASLRTGDVGIVIGGRTELALRMENQGESTAIDVRARTRSSVAALHGLLLEFGNIQPGRAVSRSVTVEVPDDTPGDSSTILVTFEERSGNAPGDLTQTFPLTRGVCPSGKLTRAEYSERRARLERAAEAGALTAEDFERFDAELLRCLQ